MSSQPKFSDHQTAVIILAAGSSSRLGKPKQLLQYQEQTLIKRAVKTALQTAGKPITVVSGFLHEEIVMEIENEPVVIIHNSDWQKGIGSSIRAGITALTESANAEKIDAVLILLCDQPLITAQHLNQLITQFYLHKRSIAATVYAGVKGVPAIFDKQLFPILQTLAFDKGAQWLFKKYQGHLTIVPFEGASVDIDTQEDYCRLIGISKKQ